jgi:hypothetical protein
LQEVDLPKGDIRSKTTVGEDGAASLDEMKSTSRAVVHWWALTAQSNLVEVLEVQHAAKERTGPRKDGGRELKFPDEGGERGEGYLRVVSGCGQEGSEFCEALGGT